MMKILELLALKYEMSWVMLTVFTGSFPSLSGLSLPLPETLTQQALTVVICAFNHRKSEGVTFLQGEVRIHGGRILTKRSGGRKTRDSEQVLQAVK
jgi:hypothetical protein